MARRKKTKEELILNGIGQIIHVFNGPWGESRIKDGYNPLDYIFHGEQWCPECRIKMEHIESEEYWRCPVCNYSITDSEVEDGYGCASLEATYEDDYGEYYNDDDYNEEDDWE